MVSRFALAFALFALTVPSAAQRPAYAVSQDIGAIMSAYREDLVLGSVKFHAVDRRPVLFLLQSQELDYVVEPRRYAFGHLEQAFRQRWAVPLGLQRGPRPLPILVLSDRKLYDRAGGEASEDARFDLRRNHLVTHWAKLQQTHDRLHVLYRELVRQIIASYAKDMASVPADWLGYGIGEQLGTRPRAALLTDRDPEFGTLDSARVGKLAEYANRTMRWQEHERLSFLHHPLAVTTFASVKDYLGATRAKSGSDRVDQLRVFRLCSYATAVFFEKAYKGHFRPKLVELLRTEYGGAHGLAAMRKVFPDGELSALPRLFDAFVRNPAGAIAAELPSGADVTAAAGVVAEGALYGGLKSTAAVTAAAMPPQPPVLSLASALVDYRRLDLGGSEDRLKANKGDDANELRAAIKTLDEVVTAWGEKVAKGGVRLAMPDPDKPTRFLTYGVKSFDDESMDLVLEKKGERRAKLWEVPAHLLGESMLKLKLLDTAEKKRAVQLLVALYCRTLSQSESRKAERRAQRKDLVGGFDFVDRCAPLLDGAAAITAAESTVKASSNPEKTLETVAASLRKLPSGAERDWLVKHAFQKLVNVAYTRSPERMPKLAGKVTLLDGGKVRVEYDWKNERQRDDWISLDANKEGLQLPGLLGWKVDNTSVSVDTDEKELHIRSQAALLHKLQFQGDFKVETVFGMREVEHEEETRLRVLGPPFWLFHARKGNTHLLGRWVNMSAYANGRRRRSKSLKKEALQSAFEVIREYDPMVFERKGDRMFLSAGDEVLAEMDASKVAALGAIMMVQPAYQEKDAEPAGVVGYTVIEGVPHGACLEKGRAGFVKRWMGKVR